MIYHLTRHELADHPVGAVVMQRGKELRTTDTVGSARRIFRRGETLVIPVIDGGRYVGSVGRDLLESDVADETPIVSVTTDDVPVATERTPTGRALELLDAEGGQRLVVVADDGATYVGIVCLRTDRVRLCVDARCLEATLLP